MFENAEQIFSGFRLATMAEPNLPLATDSEGRVQFRQPTEPYGAIENAVVGVRAGKVVWVLPPGKIPESSRAAEVIHGHGRWLTPGLIDCHTHLVYAGNRAQEWEARLGGARYGDILLSGGGILSSVRATRAATEEELVASAAKRLRLLMTEGVTTIEIKSGYGLDLETELKMLRAARRLASKFEIRIETTLLAAHAVPPEFKGRADDYVQLICKEIIPAAADECSAVDAFCETIAFDIRQTERVLQAALDHGLKIKVHAEQLSRTGMAVRAAEMGAVSVDHLEYLSREDCVALSRAGTVATLLPGAFYFLRETQLPPVAALRAAGVPMAIATDSNPGSSPVLSPLLMGNMACTLFGLTPEEAMTGMSIHAARALGLADRVGSIAPNQKADFAVWDVNSPGEILYGMGYQPCVATYLSGKLRHHDG